MALTDRQEKELVGGGDTLQHYHLADRGPFPIPHGYFYSTTSQTAASTTVAYTVTLDTTDFHNGVDLESGTKLRVKAPGVYNLQFSFQAGSTSSNNHDLEIWLSKNGSDVANTTTLIDVPAKHGGTHGHVVAAWNYFVRMSRNDYVEMKWRVESTAIELLALPAGVSPTRPATPSVIISMHLVSI